MLDSERRVLAALSLEVGHGQIRRVMSAVTPTRLAHLGVVSTLGERVRRD